MKEPLFSTTTESPEHTGRFAAALAARCRVGDCILLRGDLGAGKTAFARGFVGALCDDAEEVVSPTFTLVQTYPMRSGGALWHFDLYRLEHRQDICELGLEEALSDGLSLIEWPQRAEGMLPDASLDIAIDYGAHPGQRIFNVSGAPGLWRERLDALQEHKE